MPNDNVNWEYNYLTLVDDVANGLPQESRAGPVHMKIGTSLNIRLKDGEFPLLTTRKMFYKPVLGELAAFLQGSAHNADFIKNGCNYWTPNARSWVANKDVLKDEHLSVGLIYGYQWRQFNDSTHCDQLAEAKRMILEDPTSRRIIVSAWNPQQLHDMCLPPCHVVFQFHVVKTDTARLYCSVCMRSVDLCLGLPSDIILYYALLATMAHDTGLKVGGLAFSFGNAHVYTAHLKQFADQWLRGNKILSPPRYSIYGTDLLNSFKPDNIQIHDYNPMEAIKYELFA